MIIDKKNINIVILLLSVTFFVCNWLMDISLFWMKTDSCAGNGMINICNNFLFYHITWYISMIIFIIVSIISLVNNNEIKVIDKYKCSKCHKEFENVMNDRNEFYRMINHKCIFDKKCLGDK